MKQAALFLDRDGVINIDHAYIHQKQAFDFIDGIFELVSTAKKLSYLVVIVTNQAGIGRGYYSEADFHLLMSWVEEQFNANNGQIDGIYFCPDHPEHGLGNYRNQSDFRKPGPGMLLQAALELNIDLSQSIMVGDKDSDMLAALAAGIPARLHFSPNDSTASTARITHLREALPFLNTSLFSNT